MNFKDYLKPTQAAHFLGMTRSEFIQNVNRGKIPYHRTELSRDRYFRIETLQNLLDQLNISSKEIKSNCDFMGISLNDNDL